MIATLKQDSKRFEQEQARRQHGQPGRYGQVHVSRSPNASPGSYGQSATFNDRQRQSRADVPPDVRPDFSQSGYAGYPIDARMDTNMDDDYDGDRLGAGRYGNQEQPRIDTRVDPRMDPRQDPRQQPPISRHAPIPPISQGYQDPYYQVQPVSSTFYSPSSEPRTVGPNTTPPPSMSRVGQT